jgi:chromosome segregation ATPase
MKYIAIITVIGLFGCGAGKGLNKRTDKKDQELEALVQELTLEVADLRQDLSQALDTLSKSQAVIQQQANTIEDLETTLSDILSEDDGEDSPTTIECEVVP